MTRSERVTRARRPAADAGPAITPVCSSSVVAARERDALEIARAALQAADDSDPHEREFSARSGPLV